jgi:hypothetical protein
MFLDYFLGAKILHNLITDSLIFIKIQNVNHEQIK